MSPVRRARAGLDPTDGRAGGACRVEPARFEAPPRRDRRRHRGRRGRGLAGAAAALACAGADGELAPLLVDLGGRAPRPTLIASAAARALEERLAAHLPQARVAARGQVCHLAAPADAEGLERGRRGGRRSPAARSRSSTCRPASCRRCSPTRRRRGSPGRCCAPTSASDRALLALVVRDLLDRGLAVGVLKRRLGWVAERRALFGALGPDADGLSPSLAAAARSVRVRIGEYGAGS